MADDDDDAVMAQMRAVLRAIAEYDRDVCGTDAAFQQWETTRPRRFTCAPSDVNERLARFFSPAMVVHDGMRVYYYANFFGSSRALMVAVVGKRCTELAVFAAVQELLRVAAVECHLQAVVEPINATLV